MRKKRNENSTLLLIGASTLPWGQVLHETLSVSYQVALRPPTFDLLTDAIKLKPAIVFLDIHPQRPDLALDLLSRMRSMPSLNYTAIIAVGRTGDDQSRLKAFEACANDFIEMPISPRELLARVSSRLRLEGTRESDRRAEHNRRIRCGQAQIDTQTMDVTVAGQSVALTTLEFALLRFFLLHPRRVLSRAEILNAVWDDTRVTARTVDAHIALLRRKLPRFDYEIRTIYAAGYSLRPATVADLPLAAHTAPILETG